MAISDRVLSVKNALILRKMASSTTSYASERLRGRGFTIGQTTTSATSSSAAVSRSSDKYVSTQAEATLRATVEKMWASLSPQPLRQLSNVELFRRANPELAASIQITTQSLSAWSETQMAYATDEQKSQLETNLEQTRQLAEQMGLESGLWSVESLAHDLAVFGLDLTALNGDPDALIQTIRDKSLEQIAQLENGFSGTDSELASARFRITGASARLVNGLQNAGGRSAGSASSSVSVELDGVRVNASFVIAVGSVIVDPLVLDLNGDGIDLKGSADGVEFDMDGDGEATNMGFIRGDDAFLFVDEYGDGVVRDGRQLFGNADGHANGFEKLASYDDNGDGVIDANDAVWDKLRVWVETTEDGVCEAGETMSLAEAGISSIGVGYENVRQDDGNGNLIGQVGVFTRSDGTSGLAADVWLQEGEKSPEQTEAEQAEAAVPANVSALLRELERLR